MTTPIEGLLKDFDVDHRLRAVRAQNGCMAFVSLTTVHRKERQREAEGKSFIVGCDQERVSLKEGSSL